MDELSVQASLVRQTLVPSASAGTYSKQWDNYLKWAALKQLTEDTIYSEDSLLVYFQELSKHYAPSSMWTIFSCINCYFQIHKGINIKQFYSLVRFLKQLSATHVPKQAKAFTEKEISLYLQSAPNDGCILL